MATKKPKIEYGMVIGNIAAIDSDNTISLQTFWNAMETKYPQAEGWVVVDRTMTPNTGQVFTVAYHLEKVNE